MYLMFGWDRMRDLIQGEACIMCPMVAWYGA